MASPSVPVIKPAKTNPSSPPLPAAGMAIPTMDIPVDDLPARAAKGSANSKSVARQLAIDEKLRTLVPGKARIFELSPTDTVRGMKTRLSRSASRLRLDNLIIDSTMLGGVEKVYARIAPQPSDAPS